MENQEINSQETNGKQEKKRWHSVRDAVIFFLIICSICGCAAVAVGTIKEVYAPHIATEAEELEDRDINSLQWFEFQLDSVNYQVPAAWSDFAENGWVLAENPVIGAGASVPVAAEKGDEIIYLILENRTNVSMNAYNCTVSQITVQCSEDESKNPIFYSTGGLSLRMDYDKMKEALGIYDKAEKSGDIYTYTYYYGDAAIEIEIESALGIQSIKLNRADTE